MIDLYLEKISSDIAEHNAIHGHSMQDGLMKMEKLDELLIPAETAITFEPGGYHIMFLNLKQSIIPGQKITLLLTFSNGTQLSIEALAKSY